jgi:hypothetical protein
VLVEGVEADRRDVRRLATTLLLVLAVAPSAHAGTGGTAAGAPSGGATGGTPVDPSWVPGGGGGPAPAPRPERDTRSPRGERPVRSFARTDIPRAYLKLYRAAGRRYGIDWRLLAALGKNESDHGRARLPGVISGLNFANCCSGPMQICQVASCGEVWQAYRRDGDGDGEISIYDPADSIHAAAALVVDLRAMVGRNPRMVMAAYNAGPGTVLKYRGVPPIDETRLYVRNGVRYLRLLR